MSGYVWCNPGCRFFRCAKNALTIKPVKALPNGEELLRRQRELYGNTPPVIFYCSWVNDVCIGYKCNYAACAKNAILPDGRCGLTARRRRRKTRSLEQEALEEEEEFEEIEAMLKRKGYRL